MVKKKAYGILMMQTVYIRRVTRGACTRRKFRASNFTRLTDSRFKSYARDMRCAIKVNDLRNSRFVFQCYHNRKCCDCDFRLQRCDARCVHARFCAHNFSWRTSSLLELYVLDFEVHVCSMLTLKSLRIVNSRPVTLFFCNSV